MANNGIPLHNNLGVHNTKALPEKTFKISFRTLYK